jgi:MFS family permease
MVNVVGSGALARDIATVVGGASDTIWPASTIAILTVVLSPPVSQAADYWGRKWLLVCLTACGCVGSIIVSRADSIGMAITGFTIGGISFGAQPLLHAVTSEVLPRKYRPLAQGTVNMSAALGAIIALLVGGSLTRNGNAAGFRTYWYIGAAIYAATAVICAILYNPPTRKLQAELTTKEKLRCLDWIGYVLLAAGLVFFCIGLSWSQNPYSWTNAHVLATFLIGVVLSSALIVYEWRFKSDGMFHHALFSSRNFPIALGCVFVEGLVFFSANNYFAFEISTLYTTDSLTVSVHYSIVFITDIVASILAGAYCSVSKSIRLPATCAFVMFMIFNILMANIHVQTSSTNIWGYPIFLGVGLGMGLSSLLAVGQLSTPPHLIATASGLMISVRSLGGAVGLAIYNAVFNHGVAANLGSKVAAATIPLGLPPASIGPLIVGLTSGDAAAAGQVPGATPAIIKVAVLALQEAFVIAFRYVWVAAGAFALVALVGTVFSFSMNDDIGANYPSKQHHFLFETRRRSSQLVLMLPSR